MGSDKTEKIVIRCSEPTKEEWAAWAATKDDAEEALLLLLDDVETGRSGTPF